MIMKTHSNLSRAPRAVCVAVALALLLLLALPARAQITPGEISNLRNTVGDRIEAATVLGGDFGATGASYERGSGNTIDLSKFGGWGDIGDPMQLGDLPIAWQPQLQGEMGYLTGKRTFGASDTFNGESLNGAESKYWDYSIQFGGGPRLWFNDAFSIAPTFMGMFGNTKNSFYPNGSAVTPANQALVKGLGLVDYNVNTWTIRPAGDVQYIYTWRRTIFTLSFFDASSTTESFSASNPNVNVNGNSETWMNKIDVDVPLGKDLWGHELRTGGYFSRTEYYGDIQNGLGLNHLYEIHPRLVLDYL